MKDIAFDHGSAVQPDALCVNGAFDHSADRQLLRDEVAIDFCAFAYQNGQRPNLALDLAQYMHCAFVNNPADHSHATTDSGNLIGWYPCCRLCCCRGLRLLNGDRRFIIIVFGLSKHCTLLVRVDLCSRLSGGVVDAMETVSESGQYLPPGRSSRFGDLLDGYCGADYRRHFSIPCSSAIGQIG